MGSHEYMVKTIKFLMYFKADNLTLYAPTNALSNYRRGHASIRIPEYLSSDCSDTTEGSSFNEELSSNDTPVTSSLVLQNAENVDSSSDEILEEQRVPRE
ncbi:hypothetical protein NPIL_686241 [Nephila pilipes]|uniref:Uncharacterized protein n=1 Tax=Nephila pilipes TaxID=299642 RepID=A0A8X6QL76_NEPPI|nr:hypothetical protein NPIL_686241 [Nephila pilipes]